MESLHSKLQELGPAIQGLMALGGTPGLSLSVATKDQPTYHANYGYRDQEAALPVDENTMFPACSLAKGLCAAAFGILVERGAVSWDTLAKDAAPSYQPADSFLRDQTTMRDLFSHRSGMSSCGNLVNGCEGNILIAKEDCMRVVNEQVLLPGNIGAFAYNSTAYDVCDEAIEHLSGMSVGAFLQENVFAQLGLERTSMAPPPEGTDNVSKAYNALDDGTPVCIPGPKTGDHGISSGSGGLHSCASDLARLYSSFVRSLNHEFENQQSSTPGSPLKQISRLMSAHVPMFTTSINEISYGLGWVRVQLPNTMGHIGLNGRLLQDDMPVVGKGRPDQLVLYHQGTLPGALAVVILVPETESVVVVLSNSLALTDVPDWVSQMVLEQLLDVPSSSRIDFSAYAKKSIASNLGWYDRIVRGLNQRRPRVTEPPRSLISYVGTYVDESRVFSVVVALADGTLSWAFQGRHSEKYLLAHYDGDTFTWLRTRNELSRRGRWVLGNDSDPSFWMVSFSLDEQGRIGTIAWRHDPSLEPILYKRQQPKAG